MGEASIDGLLKSISSKLENENNGEAVKALIEKNNTLNNQINSCKSEVSDLYDIFNDYVNDMT